MTRYFHIVFQQRIGSELNTGTLQMTTEGTYINNEFIQNELGGTIIIINIIELSKSDYEDFIKVRTPTQNSKPKTKN